MAVDKKQTIKDILLNIDARISHIEDITADHRSSILKLVKQGNSIVKFLKELEIESMEDVKISYESLDEPTIGLSSLPPLTGDKPKINEKVRELLEKFLEKRQDLEEFEKELKKFKEMINPGQIGES